MEGITDAYMQAKRVCKDFEIKMLILIIMIFILKVIFSKTDGFKSFRKMYLKKFHLDSAKFLSVAGLAWKAALKKDWSKIRITNWYSYAFTGWKRN